MSTFSSFKSLLTNNLAKIFPTLFSATDQASPPVSAATANKSQQQLSSSSAAQACKQKPRRGGVGQKKSATSTRAKASTSAKASTNKSMPRPLTRGQKAQKAKLERKRKYQQKKEGKRRQGLLANHEIESFLVYHFPSKTFYVRLDNDQRIGITHQEYLSLPPQKQQQAIDELMIDYKLSPLVNTST